MTHLLLAAALAASSLGATVDTTIAVRAGGRLELENFTGDVRVTAWSRPEVRIQATHGRRTYVDIGRSADVLSITSGARFGPPGEVTYTITMPASMALKVSGVSTDIDVDGLEASIEAETVKGEVTVHGGRDRVSAGSIQGEVRIRGARGQVEATSVNAEVTLSDVVGAISTETVNGDITLEDVRSADLHASTVNGDVGFAGALLDDGRYRFSTHNGTVRVCVPDGTSARVTVSTTDADFTSDFPVTVEPHAHRKRIAFTLGSGRAELLMDSFQGGVVLCRQGAGARHEGHVHGPSTGAKPGDSNEEE